MARLVQPDLPGAGHLQPRQQAPPLVGDRGGELDAAFGQLPDSALDVTAHEEELVAPLLAGMHRKLAGRQREDQPAVTRVDRVEAEHVAKERSRSLGVGGMDDRVGAGDHGFAPRTNQAFAVSVKGPAGSPRRERSSSRSASCAAGSSDAVRAPAGPIPARKGVHRSSKSSYRASTSSAETETSSRAASDQSPRELPGRCIAHVAALVLCRGLGSDRCRGIPESSQQPHLAGVVPDGSAYDSAGLRDAHHLGQAPRRIAHEVDDELCQHGVERAVAERQRLGGSDADIRPRYAGAAALDERL